MSYFIRGHYGEWRECTEGEAVEQAEKTFRDFPDENVNRLIFENHVRGLTYAEWMEGRR